MAQKSQVTVGIDLGGTSIKAIVTDRKNRILATEKKDTASGSNVKVLIQEIVRMVEKITKAAGVKVKALSAVGVGAPGVIDVRRGIVGDAPNLGWKNVPLASKLEKYLGVPVVLDNDVNVGVIGEHALGAGERANSLVGIFVGTGIGGGIIFNGTIYQGSNGGAGEVGHTVLLVDGPVCSCGHRGCAEALASRTAMERDVRDAIERGRKSAIPRILKERGKDRMTSSIIQAALAEKDAVMAEVLGRAEYYLGILVANSVNTLDPERVVIGGGIAERLGKDFTIPIRRAACEYFLHPRAAKRTEIVPGALGDNAGALGAVVLARQRLGL
ncbi:MAG: ROK family protein [Terriglobia bacterium]